MEHGKNSRFLIIILHLAFMASGISTVLIGPLIPIVKTASGLDNSALAYLFPVQIAGSLTGTALTWWFSKKGRHLLASIIGCFLMALGIQIVSATGFSLIFPGLFLNGIGIGLTLPSINMLIVEFNPQKTARALNTLNFFWGIGAIACQPLLAGLSSGTDIHLPATVISAVLFTVSFAQLIFINRTTAHTHFESDGDNAIQIWSQPIAWILAGFNFIHIGYETAMGGWLPEYTRELGFSVLLAPIVIFYVFFVAGRLFTGVVLPITNENKAILIGLVITALGMVPQIFASDGSMLMVGAAVSGFGTSWIFPTTISRFSTVFGPSASRKATPFFMIGSTGAAAVPWVTGQLGRGEGHLGSGMFVLLGTLVVLIVMQVGMMVRSRQ